MDNLEHLESEFKLLGNALKSKTKLEELLLALVAVTKRMRDKEYDYERDGKDEFHRDITEAAETALMAFNEYVNTKG